ncbi:MAG: hypothetical protein KZQ90_18525 [Candidatus Thiodiazotropha sp. (ex Codakia rugifera)]|nr:hypothetical protein [Candidatus Thiodiazotropha sp. (ex Codakia rugifera)]
MMTTEEVNEQIGELMTHRFKEFADNWIKNDDIPPDVIANALATTAANIALECLGHKKTVDWFHEMGDIVQREALLQRVTIN